MGPQVTCFWGGRDSDRKPTTDPTHNLVVLRAVESGLFLVTGRMAEVAMPNQVMESVIPTTSVLRD